MPKLSEVTGPAPPRLRLSEVMPASAPAQSGVSPHSGLTREQRQQMLAGIPQAEESLSLADRAALAAEPVARSVALGGRAMLEGVGSTLGIVTDPIAYGANRLWNAVSPQQEASAGLGTARDGFSYLADQLGAPTPQTPQERVSADVTSAVAGAGLPIGLGRTLAARAPGVAEAVGRTLASRGTAQLASAGSGAAAAGATRESGGGTGAQVAAGLAGGLAPSVGVAGGHEAVRRAVRGGEAGRRQMEQGIEDFRVLGAQPSVGQAAGNWRAQGFESLLAGGPTSGGVMTRFAERQADDIGRGLHRLADDFMPNASAERAGRAVERGAETVANNIRATRQALYWQADRQIPDTTRLPMTNTQRTLQDLTALTPGAESTTAQLVDPQIAALARTMGEDLLAARATGAGGIPYSAAREIRSRIGQELSEYSLVADKPTAQYKRLYAALSRDLEEAAKAQGPDAERATRRANNYTRASADRLEQVERVVNRNGGPEKIFNAVMSGTRDGGTTLRAVMQSLPKEGQRAVTAAVIKRMGLATPGMQDAGGEVFSANTFLTNWNRVSPEAKRALFNRHGLGFSENMDKIARVASRLREGSRVFANPSGTANRALAYSYGAGLAGTGAAAAFTGTVFPFVLTALSGLAGNAAARAMTNPRFVTWLAQTTEMPAGEVLQQVNVLKGIAERTGEDELADVATALEVQATSTGPER